MAVTVNFNTIRQRASQIYTIVSTSIASASIHFAPHNVVDSKSLSRVVLI